ncbi:LTA synthase family protein [Bifidobacterium callitrichidarum]|nr:alkaline phosphatase family protein [Bifidobacterium callitrichidarum]
MNKKRTAGRKQDGKVQSTKPQSAASQASASFPASTAPRMSSDQKASFDWANEFRKIKDNYVPGDLSTLLADWRNRASRPFRAIGKALRWIWQGWQPFAHVLLYVLVFVTLTASSVFVLHLGVHTVDNFKYAAEFVSQMWEQQHYQYLLNCIIAGLIYAFLVFLINRFWLATAVYVIFIAVFTAANYFKILMRNEPVIPADLTFLKGNAAEIASFLPNGSEGLVRNIVITLVIVTGVLVLFYILDSRKAIIKATKHKGLAWSARILLTLTPALCIGFLGGTLGAQNSWTYATAQKVFSDTPFLWNSFADAYTNGPLVNFVRLMYNKAMNEPAGYSKDAMQAIAEKYTAEADTINDNRSQNMTDSTVIMLLSESFSDPTRVPGVTFDNDPMPNIRSLKDTTTSGLMLSPGYGGGTANIEYQSLTGMSLVNFNPSMAVPYQQLVPSQKWAPTFNQIWNDAYGEDGSEAIHPYYKGMYLRDTNYKKFGFSKFWTLQEPNVVEHQDMLGTSPYVSDEQTYQNILDRVNNEDGKHPQFLQVVTMQNHMPYTDWYPDNEFFSTDTSGLPDSERYLIDTYAKGVNITDQATADFLEQLDQIDRPITVIFYGDHLPGIYETANSDTNNAVKLHETDYFIWSNQASSSAGTKLSSDETAYTSSNYFMSLAAEHMNAKVSPFLAMLTDLRSEVPAMNTLIAEAGGIGTGQATYLDSNGNQINVSSLSKKAQQLLDDYRLVQYDMTVGKGYLKNLGFVEISSASDKS